MVSNVPDINIYYFGVISLLLLLLMTVATCAREIHIEGISVQGTVLGEGTQPPHHADLRGVVAGDNGSAYFNGYSSLSIPTYANAKFDTGVTLDFVVEEGNSRLRQVRLCVYVRA